MLTVLTPTLAQPERMHWLLDAHASLHLTDRPFEHLIVVDGGDAENVPVAVSACPDTRIIALPARVGTAAARNIGLHHAQDGYLTTLDDDDLLPPGSLDTRARLLDSGYPWVAGHLAHLQPDGEARTWQQPATAGPAPAGSVMAAWPDPAGTVPLGPTTVMTTVRMLRGLGGWAGLPTGEDLALIAALTTLFDGYITREVVYHYRSHPQQSLKVGPFTTLEPLVRQIAQQRAAALTE